MINLTSLSKSLFLIRKALRKRQPAFKNMPGKEHCFNIEQIYAIDESSYYIKGWLHAPALAKLNIISPEGGKAEISTKAFYYRRPDVEQFLGIRTAMKHGFISFFELETPSFLSDGWTAEMRSSEGDACKMSLPAVIADPANVKQIILEDFGAAYGANDSLFQHTFSALSRLQSRIQEKAAIKSIEQYGVPNESPDVSIIVPLYQRIDFVEQQLAQFAHDPEIKQADLIYVLDSPEQAGDLARLMPHLSQLYQVPCRVITLTDNFGYSVANNIGVSIARGRLLLLLNSDVFPDRPGWLGKMTAFYDATPGIGALGPKLLFEDDTLQHAGMYFELFEQSTLWTNQHYFKGFHQRVPAANKTRAVPAVTGACLMVERKLFRELGGLQGIYVQGDYEDSDLCLRLIKKGHENWYLSEVKLYHLEGQSYSPLLRRRTWHYNVWVHTRLWGDLIEALMTRYPSRYSEDDVEVAKRGAK